MLSFFFLFSLNSHDSKKENSKNAFLEKSFHFSSSEYLWSSRVIVRKSLIVTSYRQKIFDRHELSSEYLYRQKIFDRHELSSENLPMQHNIAACQIMQNRLFRCNIIMLPNIRFPFCVPANLHDIKQSIVELNVDSRQTHK